MRTFSLVLTGLTLLVAAVAPAQAQTARMFVSSTGADTNACNTTAAPCGTLGGAINKVQAGGRVHCLDAGVFNLGNTTINKAVTIDCDGVGALTDSGAIFIVAGASDVVSISGLTITGVGAVSIAASAITFNSGAGLILRNCNIQGYGASNGLAINFQPNTVATLDVIDSIIANNGTESSGGGIRVATQGSGFARVHLRNVSVSKNYVGLAAIGSGANASVEILNSSISHNKNVGVVAVGAGAVITLAGSSVVGNAGAATSGNVQSYQNNVIRGNNPDTFPPSASGLR